MYIPAPGEKFCSSQSSNPIPKACHLHQDKLLVRRAPSARAGLCSCQEYSPNDSTSAYRTSRDPRSLMRAIGFSTEHSVVWSSWWSSSSQRQRRYWRESQDAVRPMRTETFCALTWNNWRSSIDTPSWVVIFAAQHFRHNRYQTNGRASGISVRQWQARFRGHGSAG
jgi:hypothetical protein